MDNGVSGYDTGELAWDTANTTKVGSRRVTYSNIIYEYVYMYTVYLYYTLIHIEYSKVIINQLYLKMK
jgi:hypothetical protein